MPRYTTISEPDTYECMVLRDAQPVDPGDLAILLNTLTAENARLREACRKIVNASCLDPYDSGTLRQAIDDARSAIARAEGGGASAAPEPPPGSDARTADGRFVSGTGYGGERR